MFFCLEQYPTGNSTAYGFDAQEKAEARMRESVNLFLQDKHHSHVASITFIIGQRVTDDDVDPTGFRVIRRVKIRKDRMLV